jgi:hypothetical protein
MVLGLDEKRASRERMRKYARNLFGFAPTWIFSHVARPVLSKGIWRDLAVLHHLEELLARRGETAAYFMLGTLAGQRRPQDILHMERVYAWPVNHEIGYPDLSGGEEVVGQNVEAFNRGHKAVRAAMVNQWDWNRAACGERMPAGMTFRDIRAGTDVELGLSVYEPFGISQLEPLCFGAICAVSSVCGCTGYARRAAGGGGLGDNILEADFLALPHPMTEGELMSLTIERRDQIEAGAARGLAEALVEKLPRDDEAMKRMIASGHALSEKMSWERVVEDYFLPSLARAVR